MRYCLLLDGKMAKLPIAKSQLSVSQLQFLPDRLILVVQAYLRMFSQSPTARGITMSGFLKMRMKTKSPKNVTMANAIMDSAAHMPRP